MGTVRIYINPFDTTGEYTSYQDVTKYVKDKSAVVKRQVDNNEYDVGVLTYNNLSLTFNNINGKFNEADNIQSIFDYKRSNSKVKITWEINTHPLYCGFVECGTYYLGTEVTIFEGLLNDEGSKTDIDSQFINFTVLGFESILDKVETPFSSIANDDKVSEILYDCLNQSDITEILTVSLANITPSYDAVIDDVSDLEETTVKETLDILLEISNSILNIIDNVIYIVPRTATPTVQQTFYGQSARASGEDILSIKDIRQGLHKTFNLWKWEDTVLTARSSSSIEKYGVRKKEISYVGITTEATKQAILNSSRTEFGEPKKEIKLTTLLNYDTYNLAILDRVAIDYPTVFFPSDENVLPMFGVSTFGNDKFPFGVWALTFDTNTNFKILGKDINLQKEIITLTLREI